MSSSDLIFLPKGFKFSALAAGIKISGRPDLAMISAQPAASAAAMFTKNLVVAAPVQVGRASLVSSGGQVRAVIVNSGNANCATGAPGIRACEARASVSVLNRHYRSSTSAGKDHFEPDIVARASGSVR
jgi:N-acetylglutamate synthase/N-acetylornithine aminotransferase